MILRIFSLFASVSWSRCRGVRIVFFKHACYTHCKKVQQSTNLCRCPDVSAEWEVDDGLFSWSFLKAGDSNTNFPVPFKRPWGYLLLLQKVTVYLCYWNYISVQKILLVKKKPSRKQCNSGVFCIIRMRVLLGMFLLYKTIVWEVSDTDQIIYRCFTCNNTLSFSLNSLWTTVHLYQVVWILWCNLGYRFVSLPAECLWLINKSQYMLFNLVWAFFFFVCLF